MRNIKVLFSIGVIIGIIIGLLFSMFLFDHHEIKTSNTDTFTYLGEFNDSLEINNTLDSIYKNDNLPIEVIPDVETAIKVCEPILISAYGKDITEERPYIVRLCNNCWRITGSLPRKAKLGGTFSIVIQKSDGKVIKMYHTK